MKGPSPSKGSLALIQVNIRIEELDFPHDCININLHFYNCRIHLSPIVGAESAYETDEVGNG